MAGGAGSDCYLDDYPSSSMYSLRIKDDSKPSTYLKWMSSPWTKGVACLLLVAGIAAITFGSMGLAGIPFAVAILGSASFAVTVGGGVSTLLGSCLLGMSFYSDKKKRKMDDNSYKYQILDSHRFI